MSEAEDTCKFCRWFHRNNGQCRRHAPGTHLVGNNLVGPWPGVTERDWCGDFEHVPVQR
jgi:hypothetical protein